MKKLIFSLATIFLIAAGCNQSTSEPNTQQNQNNQNLPLTNNLSPSPSSPTTNQTASNPSSNSTLSVVLTSNNPPSATLASGSTQNGILSYTLTNNSNHTVEIDGLSVYLNGTVQATDIDMVYWYDKNSALLGKSTPTFGTGTSHPLSGHPGIISLISDSKGFFSLNPNSSQLISIKLDISASATDGRTLMAELVSKDYIESSKITDSINGLPLSGNQMTIGSK